VTLAAASATPPAAAASDRGRRDLLPFLERWQGLDALVVGDAILDRYVEGSVPRLAREAPVPVVAVERRTEAPGGAANTALNLAALGARVTLLTLVGDDSEATRLAGLLEAGGVEAGGMLRSAARRTVVKQRLVADGQILVRMDEGTTERLGSDDEERLRRALAAAARAAAVLVVSDYACGVLTDEILRTLEARPQPAAPLVVDAKDLLRHRRLRPTAVTPSFAEAVRAVGEPDGAAGHARAAWVAASAGRLLEATGARSAVVTLDRDGAVAVEPAAGPHRTWAVPAPERSCSGAGDTFTAALALALGAGAGIAAASDVASAAAAVVVGRATTAPCTREELGARLAPPPRVLSGPDDLAAWGREYRRRGLRVVFTNGCFDLIHPGHVALLRAACALGDRLVVAVNSDSSVRRLKGPGRPLNALEDRMEVLAALDCVDHVVPFEEDSPVRLIEALRPDVFAKGGDYTRESLPEAPMVERLGGEVRVLPYLPDRSTSELIARVGRTER
jgi:D-beta-D-heptose 7-phosphate kinase/D-beta-D-heptose 1-phosphate adenosyltransferase